MPGIPAAMAYIIVVSGLMCVATKEDVGVMDWPPSLPPPPLNKLLLLSGLRSAKESETAAAATAADVEVVLHNRLPDSFRLPKRSLCQ